MCGLGELGGVVVREFFDKEFIFFVGRWGEYFSIN